MSSTLRKRNGMGKHKNPFDSRWPPQTLKLMVRIESGEVLGKDFVGEEGVRALAREWLDDRPGQ